MIKERKVKKKFLKMFFCQKSKNVLLEKIFNSHSKFFTLLLCPILNLGLKRMIIHFTVKDRRDVGIICKIQLYEKNKKYNI